MRTERSEINLGFGRDGFIMGEVEAPDELPPEPIDGFPSAWHKQAYIDDLRRELKEARQQGDEDYARNVLAELERLGELVA